MTQQEKRGITGRLAKKLLLPLVATAVSAAAGYAGRKAPQLLEEKVMPKLRNAGSSSQGIAGGVAERAKSVVGGGDGDESENGHGEPKRISRIDDKQRQEQRRARAEQRRARRSGARS